MGHRKKIQKRKRTQMTPKMEKRQADLVHSVSEHASRRRSRYRLLTVQGTTSKVFGGRIENPD